MVLDLHVGFLQFVHGMTGEGTLLSVRNFFLSGFLEKDYFRKRKQLLDLEKSPSVHITYHHLTRYHPDYLFLKGLLVRTDVSCCF